MFKSGVETPKTVSELRQAALSSSRQDLNAIETARLVHIPEQYKLQSIRAWRGELSPRQSIKLKCYDCCGWENFKQRASDCSITTCALWHHRPITGSVIEEPVEVAEAAL